ncbi:peptidoglycan DD-metalloendopeptidase family protein [Schleiferiaceae bacterium]|jgi:murein DD-endopeptidase MepM/ murein hydrolase activator NlpD|nr:peptidoglycan DD-metalloendopeptidase family protein [Schleiferiaceae bacterium]MDC0614876.1 peptidoglycan DD-metalloendopeptidase family protein [Schleiferiaceae bacterium]
MSLKKNAWIALAALFVLLIIWVMSSKNERVTVLEEQEEVAEVVEPRVVLTLPADTLRFEKHTIASGESFGALLGKRGIGTAQIYKIAAAVEDQFNVRRIRAGIEVQFATGDSSLFPSYFIYPESKYEYWIIGLQDSIYAKKVEKEREVRRRAISGTIDDALYLSVGRSGGTQALAMSLVEVYAWTIDFFRLQKGDAFSVIYEEEYVDDTVYVGLKRVVAANLTHMGNDFYSFPYENELGFHDYYDEEGRSLRKTFLRAPLNFTRISSRYSGRRFHPVQKRWKAHLGTDYAAPTGTPIMTTADGVIIAAQYTSANGNYVKVRHNSTYTTQYLHMSKIKPGIKNGVKVKQGDVIGYVGSTGLATGPHVCYRFWVNGKQVDPYKQKLPDAKPLTADRMDVYQSYMTRLKEELDSLTQ